MDPSHPPVGSVRMSSRVYTMAGERQMLLLSHGEERLPELAGCEESLQIAVAVRRPGGPGRAPGEVLAAEDIPAVGWRLHGYVKKGLLEESKAGFVGNQI